MTRKLLSVLLALTMVLCLAPTAVLAAESEQIFYLTGEAVTIKVPEGGNSAIVNVDGNDTEVNGTVVITQSSATTATRLEIHMDDSSYTLKVVLRNVNIDAENYAAVLVYGFGNVVIELDGNNTLKSGAGYAGIEMQRLLRNTLWNPVTLTISDEDNNGSLTVIGGDNGAGIGSAGRADAQYATTIGSNITITGGKITAKGGIGAAGIGGGSAKEGSNITVSGTAQLKVQGGSKGDAVEAGAGIGNGGNSTADGAKVTPDTNGLTVCGKIQYYAPGADMETAAPTKTITGTVGSHALVHHEAQAATCTETGSVEYWQCSVCGKKLDAATDGNEITEVETEENANNHSGTAVWTQTATTHEQKWDCCPVVAVANEPHEWENGVCSECGYACLHSGGKATCTEKAVCETCNQKYGGLVPHELTHIAAKPATVAETGNTEYWHCSACDKYFSDENGTNEITLADTVIPKLAPTIIAGDGATITQGKKKALFFTSDAAFDDFLRVEVDGKTVDESRYTVKSGSTVVTLNANYVASLSRGEHTLGIVSQSGTATAKITVTRKTAGTTTTDSSTAITDKPTNNAKTKSPNTGDNSNLALWIALLLVSGGAVIGTTVVSRKKNYNR